MQMESKYYIFERQLEKLIQIFQKLQNFFHDFNEKIEEQNYFEFENDMEKFKFIFENGMFDIDDDLKYLIDKIIDQKIEENEDFIDITEKSNYSEIQNNSNCEKEGNM